MQVDGLDEKIDAIRRFTRFYTRRIGLLDKGLLKTEFSMTQARIIFELAQYEHTTSSDLINLLEMDPGYLSRILSRFEKKDLIKKTRSETDSRQFFLSLTPKGRDEFSILNERSRRQVAALLKDLSGEDQQRLINAARTIERILGTDPQSIKPYLLRRHRPGDIGWITHRHGVLYDEEYNFDETFEALVAEILAKFIKQHDPNLERIWIAEMDGEPIGSVMVVNAGDQTAQLRLLLVELKARGMGIGKRLIDECIYFARRKGYLKMKLWTQNILLEARHLYAKVGFKLVDEEPNRRFGQDLVSEFWEMDL